MSSEKGENSSIAKFAADIEIGSGYKPVKLTRSRTIASFFSAEGSFESDEFLTDKAKEDCLLNQKSGLRLKEVATMRLTCSENNLSSMSMDDTDLILQWPSMYKLRKWSAMQNNKSLVKQFQIGLEVSSEGNGLEYPHEAESWADDEKHGDFGETFNCLDLCRANSNEAFANFIEMLPQQPAQPKNNRRYSLRTLRDIYYTNKNGVIYNSTMPIPYSIFGRATGYQVIKYTIAELRSMDKCSMDKWRRSEPHFH